MFRAFLFLWFERSFNAPTLNAVVCLKFRLEDPGGLEDSEGFKVGTVGTDGLGDPGGLENLKLFWGLEGPE